MRSTCLQLSLPAVPASVRKARTAAGKAAAELGASERVVDDVRLCVSEAVSNAVRHAYGRTRGAVGLVVERDNGELRVVVRDNGAGMRRPSRTSRATGGYGLKIIRRVAERLTITSTRGAGTEVRMAFLLVATSPAAAAA